jgi:hypothetical protein
VQKYNDDEGLDDEDYDAPTGSRLARIDSVKGRKLRSPKLGARGIKSSEKQYEELLASTIDGPWNCEGADANILLTPKYTELFGQMSKINEWWVFTDVLSHIQAH